MKPINELSGRELDAAVAEEVMGWRRPRGQGATWHAPHPRGGLYGTGAGNIPTYSSSWDAAREVVEKIDPKAFVIQAERGFGEGNVDGWKFLIVKRGQIVRQSSTWRGDGDALPLAACRAALAWKRSLPGASTESERGGR